MANTYNAMDRVMEYSEEPTCFDENLKKKMVSTIMKEFAHGRSLSQLASAQLVLDDVLAEVKDQLRDLSLSNSEAPALRKRLQDKRASRERCMACFRRGSLLSDSCCYDCTHKDGMPRLTSNNCNAAELLFSRYYCETCMAKPAARKGQCWDCRARS